MRTPPTDITTAPSIDIARAPSTDITTAPWIEFLHPRYWLTWCGFGAVRLFSVLPLPLIWLIGGALGQLFYYLHAPRRRIVNRNIEKCFPELDRRARVRLAKQNFRATAQAMLDTGIAWWASKSRLRRLVQCSGSEHYEQALATGRPVILLAPHFIALDIGGLYLATEERSRLMISMYKRPKNKLLHAFVARRRERFGDAKMIESRAGMKQVVRALKRGAIFYYLPDQNPGRKNTVFVPFFGIPTATLTALGRLARITNALVVPCVSRQLPRGRGYEVTFGPPLALSPSHDDTADAARMNEAIEQAVRETPAQYFWMHRRFRARPEGEPDFYV